MEKSDKDKEERACGKCAVHIRGVGVTAELWPQCGVSPELWLCCVGRSWLRRLSCCRLLPSLCLTGTAEDAAAELAKERKGEEAATVLPVPQSHPPAVPLTEGGFASFSLPLDFAQQKWLRYLQTGTLASAKIFMSFRAKSSSTAGFKERSEDKHKEL